jgi:hypothetical protein
MFLSIGLATILVLYIILKRLRMATSSLPQTAPATIPIISNVLAFVLGGSRLRRLFQYVAPFNIYKAPNK